MNEESEKQSAMGDTSDFKGRIDKVFGALFQSDGGWRLSDAQLQKKEWKREESSSAREDTPCGSSFDGLNDMGRPKGRTIKRSGGRNSEWEGDFGDSDDDDDEKEAGEESNLGDKGEDEEEEEGRDIRFVVGMDSTLDHEDEEDEYDKVAVGREDAGERTYMREIMDTGPKINSHNSLPSSLKDLKRAGRDPRANHYAARARLEEDDEEAAAVHPDSEMVDKLSLDIKEDHRKMNDDDKENGTKKENETGSLPMEEMQSRTELKSIIKGKKRRTEFLQDMESEPPSLEEASSGPGTCSPMTDSSVEKPQKRVRFDPGINGDPAGQLEKKHDLIKVANSRKRSFVRGVSLSDSVHNGYSRVPDYIRNPSKYIHYTLDWSNEDDDMINTQAFNEFSQLVKPSAPVQMGYSTELPKSVTFIPRKRPLCSNKTREDSNYINNIQNAVEDSSENSNLAAIFPLGIAAGHATEPESPAQGNDIGESEEFGGINKNSRLHKGTRNYRSKADSDEETGA